MNRLRIKEIKDRCSNEISNTFKRYTFKIFLYEKIGEIKFSSTQSGGT